MTTQELISQLKKEPVIKAIPELRDIVNRLEKSIAKDNKISGQWSTVVSLMTDGIEYRDAMKIVGL